MEMGTISRKNKKKLKKNLVVFKNTPTFALPITGKRAEVVK